MGLCNAENSVTVFVPARDVGMRDGRVSKVMFQNQSLNGSTGLFWFQATRHPTQMSWKKEPISLQGRERRCGAFRNEGRATAAKAQGLESGILGFSWTLLLPFCFSPLLFVKGASWAITAEGISPGGELLPGALAEQLQGQKN